MPGMFDHLDIIENPCVLPGLQGLMKDGSIVYYGNFGDPLKEGEFDAILVHPADAAKLRQKVADESR